MFIRDNENVFDSRGIHFVASLQHGKLNSSESRRFRSLITRKKRAVTFRERYDGTEVQTTSSDPRRRRREIKRTDVSLSPVIPSASNVFRSHVLSSLFSVSSPLAVKTLSWILSFSESFFSFVTRSFSSSFLSFAICVFFFFYMYNYSSKCLYSVLYSSM